MNTERLEALQDAYNGVNELYGQTANRQSASVLCQALTVIRKLI